MAYAKIGTDGLAVPAKALYLRRLAAGVTNNPKLPAPIPPPVALLGVADLLDTRYNEAQAARLVSKTKTAAVDDQSAIADALVAQLASYVDAASSGNAAIIESAGFATRATPQPVGGLPAPTDVQVVPSEHAGSADVSCKPVFGAKTYLYERAVDAPAMEWKPIGASTKRSGLFNSMVSGQKYWFRLAAVGSAGQSPWSDPVPLFAP